MLQLQYLQRMVIILIYVYDLLVNFQDGVKLYDFYEWNSNDQIEHIKKMCLVKINTNQMSDILKYNIKIEKTFLESIDSKTEVFKGNKIAIIPYACLFTDGNRVVAIEFFDDGVSVYKSKLIIEEEEDILSLADRINFYDFKYKKLTTNQSNIFLTRKEIYIKNFLVREINNCYKNEMYSKLNYLYSEYFNENSNDISKDYIKLVNSMNIMLNENHFRLYSILRMSNKKKQV